MLIWFLLVLAVQYVMQLWYNRAKVTRSLWESAVLQDPVEILGGPEKKTCISFNNFSYLVIIIEKPFSL